MGKSFNTIGAYNLPLDRILLKFFKIKIFENIKYNSMSSFLLYSWLVNTSIKILDYKFQN